MPKHTNIFDWTDDRVQYLRDNAHLLSAKAMARHLGCSRNAVIGRCRRDDINLNDPAKPNVKGGGNYRKKSMSAARDKNIAGDQRGTHQKTGPKKTSLGKWATQDSDVKLHSLKTEDDLIPLAHEQPTLGKACQWPYGRSPSLMYCGRPATHSNGYRDQIAIYCEHHAARAYKFGGIRK